MGMTELETRAADRSDPAGGGFAITPSGTDPLERVTRALYIGTGGTLAVEMEWGQTVTFRNVPDGALLPVRVRRVLPETTATSIVGLY
jgi:hypothetical protein